MWRECIIRATLLHIQSHHVGRHHTLPATVMLRSPILLDLSFLFWSLRAFRRMPEATRALAKLAEKEGFEPSMSFHLYTLSRRAP